MIKTIDISKFRKSVTKNIPGITTGFHDPIDWISTGNYTLNYLISGDFYKGIPYGKVTMVAGDSGSGKSLLCTGYMSKNAQMDGAVLYTIDTENAIDEWWLKKIGIDTSPDKYIKVSLSSTDHIASELSSLLTGYNKEYEGLSYEEKPKLFVVVDSLGMLNTPSDQDQFEKGDLKGDMGRKAKALMALVRNVVNLIAPHPIAVVMTNHLYDSQDMFSPDPKISGGKGAIYASSIVLMMQKLKLKEDDSGAKTPDVTGITAVCKVMKSRYSKPFETVKIKIPYDKGIEPISGLFDLFEKSGKLQKVGNRYKYTKSSGEEMIFFRKEWDEEKFKVVMNEFTLGSMGDE